MYVIMALVLKRVLMPGEGAGILYNPEDMSKLDVATMSIGQGIALHHYKWFVSLVPFLMVGL